MAEVEAGQRYVIQKWWGFFACLLALTSRNTLQNFQIILMKRVYGDYKDGSLNNVVA